MPSDGILHAGCMMEPPDDHKVDWILDLSSAGQQPLRACRSRKEGPLAVHCDQRRCLDRWRSVVLNGVTICTDAVVAANGLPVDVNREVLVVATSAR